MAENTGKSSHAAVRKAVIPIAGWGTRMFPASKAMPKALFPIIDRVRSTILHRFPDFEGI
jgi:UTP-glucose-1-phosphate uridylyltransferase